MRHLLFIGMISILVYAGQSYGDDEFFTDNCDKMIAELDAKKAQERQDAANLIDAAAKVSEPYPKYGFGGTYFFYGPNDAWSPYGNYLPEK